VIDLLDQQLEQRLLVLTPVGKDASLVQTMLRTESIECTVCSDVSGLLRELDRGAGAILIAEEVLLAEGDARLVAALKRQPAWSDIPVLLLTRPGAESVPVDRAMYTLGNVTLLERPVRVVALASAIRSAMRARARQYQTRAYLIERDQADRRKDEFLATLAHELRNPLAPIRNWVNVLRLSGAGEPGPEFLEMMDRQVNHMVRLVDDLMELSRITRGKIELRMEPLELASVMAAAVEASRPHIESAHHTLTVSVPDEPIIVNGDMIRLTQVFSNLLNNAVKYTDDGGRISLEARRDRQDVVVTVKDSGIGIPAGALPRVFDMFVQVHESTQRAQAGLGIGLTLVRSLVEMHGGRVEAHSAGSGKGSEFVVRLPVATLQPATAESKVNGGSLALRELTRILVVDDNEDAADSLGALLRMMGADVRIAHEGPTALGLFDTFRPAAIFLDLGMPGMDGFEIARCIRSRPHGGATIIIALTGWGQERDRRRTQEAGFTMHLAKPADMDSLQAVLLSISSPVHADANGAA
jgi:signal transduction histidine kinase/ActR/RegA family two-component response regulator